jgi:hypothetical protein
MRRRALGAALLCAVAMGAGDGPAGDAPFEPTSRYESRTIEGWTVRVHRGFLDREPDLAARALGQLRHQLEAVTRAVPTRALTPLRRVVIWVEEDEPHHPCMAYHPDRGWLVENGMNPDKARCVEIADARNFLSWTRDQPWMVFHELAHAYHDQFVPGGFENDEVRDALRAAREKGLYDRVLHINGREERAYALTNPMEYLAEASEALFGTNDFYPFVRAELARHDPALHAILRRLWHLDGEREAD